MNIESAKSVKSFKILSTIAALTLFIAVGNWPYNYYVFNKWVVLIAGSYAAWYCFTLEKMTLGWLFVIAVVLFNPLTPFRFDQQIWRLLDVLAGSVFIYALAQVNKSQSNKQD